MRRLIGVTGLACLATSALADPAFDAWLGGFRDTAIANGIMGQTYDAATRDIAANETVLRRDRTQNEFSKTLWDYLDTAVSDARIANGRAALARYDSFLSALERDTGVAKEIVTAIWGLESAYGAVRGSTDVIEAMATLAHDGRRGAFFEEQLLAALQIIQMRGMNPRAMTGSWAGAMGHTQFMPTSYLDFAVDGDGDGDINIWSDDPRDALASTAHYLAENGWTRDQPWGVEVRLPDGFDYLEARRDNARMPSDWAARGIFAMNGQPVPDHAPATILLPGGAEGAAFMIFPNFAVLETYNTADSYVIGVGHLGDRIMGRAPIQGDWPYGDRALTFDERVELQRRLIAAGFDTQKIDGLVGPLTINAIRDFQLANSLVPDGYASVRLLERLR